VRLEFAGSGGQALAAVARNLVRSATPGKANLYRIFDFDKRSATTSREARYNLTERNLMLWTIFVILLVLWLLGLVSSYTLGGFIHLLLVIAIVILIINLIQGRRPL
jgi:Family of unknown function (DUF5670)